MGTNKHVEIRLDRALVNSAFLDMFTDTKLINVEVSTSDHCPLLLEPTVRVQIQSSRVATHFHSTISLVFVQKSSQNGVKKLQETLSE